MKYKSRFDRRSKWITTIAALIVLAFGVWIYLRSESTFLPAWITVLLLAIVLLLAMSIPRFVEITHSSIEIHCVVELTNIPLDEIKQVTQLSDQQMKWCIPLGGVYGIFGYYGYYLDLKEWDTFKLYAREWKNFVAIENIYEQTIVVSVSDPEAFMQNLKTLT